MAAMTRAGGRDEGGDMDLAASPLLTDLYQLNMLQAYLDRDEVKSAVFEFFMRKLPRGAGSCSPPGSRAWRPSDGPPSGESRGPLVPPSGSFESTAWGEI